MWDATATMLTIRPWNDPASDVRGFAPTSAYVEWAWLPVMGPTAASAYRRLVGGLDTSPGGYELEITELGRASGARNGSGGTSSAFRITARLVALGLARWEDTATLAVRPKAPRLIAGHAS